MKPFEFMEAMTDIRSDFLAEALDCRAFPEAADAPKMTEEEPAVTHPMRSRILAVLSAAACIGLIAGGVGLIYRLKNSGPVRNPAETTAESGTETTAPATDDSESRTTQDTQERVSTAPNGGTTAGQQTQDGTADSGTTAGQSERQTGTTGNTKPVSGTVTTAATTVRGTASTVSSTEKDKGIRGADPGQVIQQLEDGIAAGFEWLYDKEEWNGQIGCDVTYQSYGVAFLCDDIEKLKTGSIGKYPVFWSDGAWSEYGGTALVSDYEHPRGIRSGDCMVQPLSGFLKRFSANTPDSGLGTDVLFNFRREQQTVYSVLDDYSEYGMPVYMASVSTPLMNTRTGGRAMDYSELVRAISADDALTLLGSVFGVERRYGFIEDWDADLEIVFRQDDYQPDPAVFAEYGRLYSLCLDGRTYWRLCVDGMESTGTQLPTQTQNREWYAKLHRICEALQKKFPQIQSVTPSLLYFD